MRAVSGSASTSFCANLVWAALVAIGAAGCGGTQSVTPADPSATPPVARVEVQAQPNAFRDFRGPRVTTGKPFRVSVKPVAVAGVEVVIALVKVDWSTMTGPSGKDTREATANIRVQKGEEERAVMLGQGEVRTVLGTRINLLSAGEDYDKARMSYDPWIEIQVEPAAPPVDTTP
jgi:hypothetical protein